jgi:hypothetical protein
MLVAFIGYWANERVTGLHLTADGYRIVYEEVLKTIRANWADQDPEVLPMVFPAWGEAPR